MGCINARRARATAFPYKGREGGLSEPRARLVKLMGLMVSGVAAAEVLTI